MEAYCSALCQLRALLYLAQGLLNDNAHGQLLSHEDGGLSEKFAQEYISMHKACFYGRCLGFQVRLRLFACFKKTLLFKCNIVLILSLFYDAKEQLKHSWLYVAFHCCVWLRNANLFRKHNVSLCFFFSKFSPSLRPFLQTVVISMVSFGENYKKQNTSLGQCSELAGSCVST